MCLLHGHLLSTYYVPGTVLGTGDTAVKKGSKTIILMDLTFGGRGRPQTSDKQADN